ncbi:MAG TPA: hypothetical protein ENJ54_09795 [Chloroflexi bacterium]|nr:hypothetical protein [Chloroflexota bacterium]
MPSETTADPSATLRCPRCDKPVSAEDRYCPHCGVNLGIAAVMAERLVHIPAEVTTSGGLGTDALVPRLGERLVQAGVITPQQLEQALAYQREQVAKGETPLRLGQVLVRLGFVDRDTLDRVIAETILQLQEALYRANERLEKEVAERTRQLQEALARLSELQRLKANFVANISHELRTPLTHIIGYLDLLSDGTLGELNENQQRALQVMRQSAERLHRLIEDLISFSLLARGSVSVSIGVVSVDELVRRVVELIRPRLQAKPLDFQEDVTPGLVVFADGEKIGWVLQHLLDNAIKFTPAGGRVWLRVWPEEGQVFFSVEDTGIGIAKEDLMRIFEPFVQLEDSSVRHYGGTGLGLALVQQILGAHEVTLEVESEVGQGSRFTFALPRSWSEREGKMAGYSPS